MGKLSMYAAAIWATFLLLPYANGHDKHKNIDLDILEQKWGTDVTLSNASGFPFAGISTFAHLAHSRCLTNPQETFDIAIIGVPLDTGVTYRSGARFGSRAIRAASARQSKGRGFNHRAGLNPYTAGPKILDCGDMLANPFSNQLALRQMTEGFETLLSHSRPAGSGTPTILALGGDHGISLPALRNLVAIHGPLTVVHFDAHLDSWDPSTYPGGGAVWGDENLEETSFNHGSVYWLAGQEGLLKTNNSVHAGLRTRLGGDGWEDFESDDRQGWLRIAAEEVDEIGVRGIAKKIIDRVGTERKVYLSVDIDVIDCGLAPGTGTPEVGGWTTRELIAMLRAIEDLNIVGADIVEVAPAYDNAGETTALAAAQVGFEILSSIVKRQLREKVKVTGKDEL